MAAIQIYSTTYCGYCVRAKRLLDERGIPYEEIDVTGNAEVRAWLVSETGGRRTVPQIFIHGKPIGGFVELRALDKSGELAELVKSSSGGAGEDLPRA
jgi:glutaredoxin 3